VCTTSGGHTILHWAVMCGNIQAIQTICSMPTVDINIKNTQGETPIRLASRSHRSNKVIVELLGRAGERQRREHQLMQERQRALEREARELAELQESVTRMQQQTERIIGELARLEIRNRGDSDGEEIDDEELGTSGRERDVMIEETIRNDSDEESGSRTVLEYADFKQHYKQGGSKICETKDESDENIYSGTETESEGLELRETVDTIYKTVEDKISEISGRIEKLDVKIMERKKSLELPAEEDEVIMKLKIQKKELKKQLSKLTAKPKILPCPECPVCSDSMRPPTRILQCIGGHLVCEKCARQVDRFICPTCDQEFSGRATAMEQFLRTLFNHDRPE